MFFGVSMAHTYDANHPRKAQAFDFGSEDRAADLTPWKAGAAACPPTPRVPSTMLTAEPTGGKRDRPRRSTGPWAGGHAKE